MTRDTAQGSCPMRPKNTRRDFLKQTAAATALDAYRTTHRNVFAEQEPNLHTILPEPKAGIGQRAFLVQTKDGNVLWDCVPPLDDATIRKVTALGGVKAIAVSHPHYYTTVVEW